jgi:hypothetical protein
MKVKDSGKRTEFSTGAVRDDRVGKGRFDLLPIYPLFEIAKLYEEGQRKYPPDANIPFPSPDDENWKKGMDICSLLCSTMRHLLKLSARLDDEPHGAMACWGIMNTMETLRLIEEGILPKELDNRGRAIDLKWLASAYEVGKMKDLTKTE